MRTPAKSSSFRAKPHPPAGRFHKGAYYGWWGSQCGGNFQDWFLKWQSGRVAEAQYRLLQHCAREGPYAGLAEQAAIAHPASWVIDRDGGLLSIQAWDQALQAMEKRELHLEAALLGVLFLSCIHREESREVQLLSHVPPSFPSTFCCVLRGMWEPLRGGWAN